VRNLRRDIAAYNSLAALADDEEKDEQADETGWKLVHADVFRPPANHPMLFCVFMGSGAQLAITCLAAICFSAVGFLSPARRGSLMLAFLVLYMLCGVFAGFLSSRLYKSFRGRQWQLCTIITALFYPGIAFGTFVFFNIILFFLESSASAPFLDVLIVACMWCGVSIPLVFLGAYFGYKMEAIEFPTVTSTIARAIPPPAHVLLQPTIGMCMAGIIPFVAAYVELFFIMTSLWMDQFYYVFGFTLLVYIIMVITCAEVTVLLVYYQLCAENHRWWWFSFFSSGSTAFYTFVYSMFWFRQLEASRLLMTYLLYFGYMFLICFGILLVFGMVGSMTCLWFTRKIFSTIKV
jgi:transmembrane 9 superfamily protein 2/4